MTTARWILGFLAGLAALAVTVFLSPLGFPVGIAIVAAVSMVRPRPVAAGGVCMAWGAGFLVVMWQATESCAALNRQPNARCTMGDNTPFAMTGIAVLVLGVVLTAYAVWRARAVAVASAP